MKISEHDKYIEWFDKYANFLTQTQKQCFQLYFFEDLSLSEIAQIVVTTRSAVHDAITKAKKKLEKIHCQMNSL